MFEKFNRQSGVEAAVKSVLKPFYSRRKISKDQYKEIMKKTVPKARLNRQSGSESNNLCTYCGFYCVDSQKNPGGRGDQH